MVRSAAMNRMISLVFAPLLLAATASAQTPEQPQDGNALFQRTCAQCHMGNVPRAPDMDALRAMSADRVLAAMETGPMISMATGRSVADRRAIAEAVTGKKLRNTLELTPLPKAMCSASAANAPFNPGSGPSWSGWGGVGTSNA